jgi:hypothetical protein
MPTAQTDFMRLRHAQLGTRVCSQQTVYNFAGSFGFNVQGVGLQALLEYARRAGQLVP